MMDIKKIAIITGPVLFAGGVYLFISNNKNETKGNITNQYHTTSIIDPKANDTVIIKSKSKIYEMKNQNDAQKRNQKSLNNDDFFGGKNPNDTAIAIYKKSDYSHLNSNTSSSDSIDTTITKKTPLLNITKEKQETHQKNTVKKMPKKDFIPKEAPKRKKRSFHSSFDEEQEENLTASTSGTEKISSSYISGLVHDKTTVRSGQKVHIRLTQDCIIAGHKVPKDTDLAGIASIINERVMLKISSFELNGKLIFTKLIVFDQDGVEGIYAEGGINHDVTLSTITSGIQAGAAQIPTVGSYIGQAGSRKVSDPSVTIFAGHKVYIEEIKK